MIRLLKYFWILLLIFTFSVNLFAGNPDRVGSAGASQLLINPWSRTSGMGSSNIASVRGLESLYGNVAGLAFTENTELIFSRTSWIADIPINSFGFSQRMSESSVLAVAISSMSLSDITGIPRPTVVRKIKYLIDNNYITINEKKLLHINIQGTVLKRSSDLQDANIKSLSSFIHKVFNQIKIIDSSKDKDDNFIPSYLR